MKKTRTLLLAIPAVLLAASVGAQTFTGRDVGTPSLPGSVTGTPPGVQTIVGGGSDIWGTSDNFYYYYTTVTGQVWDAKVRVQDLQGPDHWTKCELMVRIPDSTGIPQGPDPFIAMMTTRSAGQNQIGPQWRSSRGGNADWNALNQTVRPGYPDVWLRIKREGSLFSLYYGTNGTDWVKYVDIDTAKRDVVGADNGTTFGTPWPDPILVGVAVTAHNDGDMTGGVATVSDLSLTVTPSVPNLVAVTQVQDATAYKGSEAFFSFAATNAAIAHGAVGGLQWYKNDQVVPNATGPNFALLASGTDNGARVYCKASVGPASMFSATGIVTVLAATEYPGYLKYQVLPGLSRMDVVGGNYAAANITRVSALTNFDAPANWSDNYASRISGYFIPPADGNYVFFIAADDDADLYLSTDSEPANCRLIAQEVSWSPRNGWVGTGSSQKRSDTWSPDGGATFPYNSGIPLVAGQKYFIMAAHHEGGGGDNLGVYYKTVFDPDPLDGDPSNLTNGVISMLTWPATTLTITDQPDDVTVFEGLDVIFNVAATTDAELTPVYQWRRNGVELAGKNATTLRFPATLADNGAKYDCVITLPSTSLSVTSAQATLTVQASVFITGIVKRELWGPNNSSVTRTAVEDDTAGLPTSTDFLTRFDTTDFANNYVQRLSTWFIPPTSGNYVFLVSSDDDSDLFLSTNDDPVNKRLIAQQTSWNATREWSSATGQRRSDQFSPDGGATVPYASGIPLVAGQKYYIEAVHHEGGGGDNFSAYYKLITEVDPANGTPSNLTGDRIGIKLPAPTYLRLTTQPQNATAHGWDQAVFTVGAETDALYPPTYQWRRNGSPIANATATVYSLVTSTNDNGAVFDCVVNLSQYGSVTSAPATLTVLGDAVFVSGKLKEEYFAGAAFDAVLQGNVGLPTQLNTWTNFESGTDIADDFTRRVSGVFIPPTTGDYVFFTSSDDESSIFVSTNSDQPNTKRLVCQQTSWNPARAWVTGNDANMRRSDTWTPDGVNYPWQTGIHLEAGKHYYIEGVQREGSGGDNFAVTYKLISDPDPLDGDAPLLTGAVIGYMAPPAPPEQPQITITRSGNNVVISWTPAGGHLESRATLGDGTWTSEGPANPAILPIAGEKYFRVVVP